MAQVAPRRRRFAPILGSIAHAQRIEVDEEPVVAAAPVPDVPEAPSISVPPALAPAAIAPPVMADAPMPLLAPALASTVAPAPVAAPPAPVAAAAVPPSLLTTVVHSLESRTVLVNGRPYVRLEPIGKGGSSKVYKVLGPDLKVYALKRVRAESDDAMALYRNEVQVLLRLRGADCIVHLFEAAADEARRRIDMVLEYGDTDLNRVLQRPDGAVPLSENAVRFYFEQMLRAVRTIHAHGIVHGDLKPANFLLAEGALKLIDFGIARAVAEDVTSVAHDSQVGTLNYMAPEALQADTDASGGTRRTHTGRAADVWSLGCILYQMVYGRTPFAAIRDPLRKMQAIVSAAHEIAFPPTPLGDAVPVMRACLVRDRHQRATIDDLLGAPFLAPSAALAALTRR